jgi:predicted lipid-binding transport protein (Tim44 family)
MGWLIGLFAPKLGQKMATFVSYLLVILVILGLVYWALDSYGDRKFDEGVKANQAQVDKALEQLKTDAAESATKADDKAAARAEVFVEQQQADKEALDEAQRNGTSPLDALFGG